MNCCKNKIVFICTAIAVAVIILFVLCCALRPFKSPKKEPEPKNLKPEEVLWFVRKFPCTVSECTNNNFNSWNDKVDKKIKAEWKDRKKLKEKCQDKDLWIPLNANDSLKIELTWRRWREHHKSCNSSYHTNARNCSADSSMKLYDPITVIDNMFEVNLQKTFGFLRPIFWQNETEKWYLMRGEWMYEVLHSPSAMYFANINQIDEMKSYYQPLQPKYVSKAKSFEIDLVNNFFLPNLTAADLEDRHIVFVIHGIGHHEGEDKIVKNANNIRDGFSKYLKKFHPNYNMPIIIPVPWRYTLTMDDEKILNSMILRPEFAKEMGLILNDVFYYLSPYKKDIIEKLIKEINNKFYTFKKHNTNFNGTISFLAHSLGSVISFDLLNNPKYAEKLEFKVENLFFIGSPVGRFLINKKFTVDQLNQNHWIKNGKLFNILHSDDPIAHRLETVFNNDYKYVAPSELYLNKYFRKGYAKTLKISEEEAFELASFHNYFISDATKLHDSFITIDYAEYGYTFLDDSVTFNASGIFKNTLEFLKKRFSGKKILKNLEIIRNFAATRIPHRFDYDLYKTEYDENGEENTVNIERKFIDWIGAVGFAHMSYWNRPEVIALMTNAIYDYHPDFQYNDNKNAGAFTNGQKYSWKIFAYKCFDWFWRILFALHIIYCFYSNFNEIKKQILNWPRNYEILENETEMHEIPPPPPLPPISPILNRSIFLNFKKYLNFSRLYLNKIVLFCIKTPNSVLMLTCVIWLLYFFIAAIIYLNFSSLVVKITVLVVGIIPTVVISLLYMCFILHAFLTKQWKLLHNWFHLLFYIVVTFLLFALRSPITIAIIGWNIKKLLAPWIDIKDFWIHLIYFIFFFPGIFLFLFTEKAYNKHTIYRYIFTTVCSLLIISAFLWGVEFYAKQFRDYQLGCIYSVGKGLCREYILYNSETKTVVPTRNEFPLLSASIVLNMLSWSGHAAIYLTQKFISL